MCVFPLTLCELHKAEMKVHHYKIRDVALCPQGCSEQGPPGSFRDSVTPFQRECAYEPCGEAFVPDPYNPTQRFHIRRCRQAAYRLRRKSEQVAEVG